MSLENSRGRPFEESLSALMDNEADELEMRRLLKNAPNDQALADTWRRYNLVRSVLQHEEVVPVSSAASSRILEAIAAEEAYVPDSTQHLQKSVKPQLWQTFGRTAIAASVALAAYVGFQSLLVDPLSQAPVASSSPSVNSLAPNSQLASGTSVEFDAQAQQRLNDYIRGVSIQYTDDNLSRPQFNILEDSQLIRQVNQIEP